uniref:Uncharacterized protein n=1 Tax=Avena sativa TaxID=4498 RepID=A0ACD5TDS3_AVESA
MAPADLQEACSWIQLLNPQSDADVRASIISYGELAQAAYDGFNSDEGSPHAGSCIYSTANLLAASGVSHPGRYRVTKFVYATAGQSAALTRSAASSMPQVTDALFVFPATEEEKWTLPESNWMGYVAVATEQGAAALGRRDIVVVWRGTVNGVDWGSDFDYRMASAAPVLGPSPAADFKDAKVHHGFLSVYTSKGQNSKRNKTSARDQVLEEVQRLMEVFKDEVTSITVTGHSLGASLATLNAVDMAANALNVPSSNRQPPCPVTAMLFASPQVGNDKFVSAFASFQPHLQALHVVNAEDIVPFLPTPLLGYADLATAATMPIDTTRSPYLRPGNLGTYHNLECYLHGVAGDHGDGRGFQLVVDRDVALVNKGTNALKDEYPVPEKRWVTNNKCKAKGIVGRWKLENLSNNN